MISCSEAKENLGAFYDGECQEPFRADLASHIAHCSHCQQAMDEWVALSSHVFSAKPRQAPAFLWTRVLADIEAQQAAAQGWWMEWRWMARVTIAASLLVGLGSYYLLSQTAVPLETALEGVSPQQEAIQIASASISNPEESMTALLEGESWVVN